MNETELEEIALMLPFYVNGTLNDVDIARVDNALAAEASLREELEDVKALSGMVTAGAEEWDAQRAPAGEERLSRLMDRIAAEPKQAAEAAPAETQRVVKMEPAKPGFFASLFQPAWKPAFAAMALVAVAQGAVLYSDLGPANNNDGEFQTASGPDDSEAAASNFRILLRISPSASWADVQSLLAEHELTIVNGPSDGVIEVEVGTRLNEAEQEQLANSLKASSAISAVLTAG